jgi:hypothetical protein
MISAISQPGVVVLGVLAIGVGFSITVIASRRAV